MKNDFSFFANSILLGVGLAMDAYLSPEMKSTGEAIGYDEKLHRAVYKALTAEYLHNYGIRALVKRKISEGSEEILNAIKSGSVSYVINTRAILSGIHNGDGVAIRNCATQNGVSLFTSLDTVKLLLDVLEEQTIKVSTIF